MIRVAAIFIFLLLSNFNGHTQNIFQRKIPDSLLFKNKLPGFSYAVFNGDSILEFGFAGHENLAEKISVDEHTKFRIGSLTKSFVALAAIKLISQGKLNLHAPIRTLLPEGYFQNDFEKSHPIGLVHLLNHSAGFDDMHPNEYFIRSENVRPGLSECLKKVDNSRIARWPPGTRFAYSNPGYSLIALLIEKASGMEWEKYVRDSILIPLEIYDATVFQTKTSAEKLAQGYKDSGNTATPYIPIFHRAAGCFEMSAKDLAKLGMYFLAEGRNDSILQIPPSFLLQMELQQSTMAAQAGIETGYGLGTSTGFRFERKFQGHTGGINGFYSTLHYYRSANIGIVMLFNTERVNKETEIGLEWQLLEEYLNAAEPEKKCNGIPSEMPPSGFYKFQAERNSLLTFLSDILADLNLKVKDSLLVVSGFSEPVDTLVSCGGKFWRKKSETEATFVFGFAENGKAWVQFHNSFFEKRANWKPILLRILLISGIFFSLFYLIWFFVSLIRFFLGGLRTKIRARLFPALGTIMVFLLPVLGLNMRLENIGLIEPFSFLIFSMTLILPLVVFASWFICLFTKAMTTNGRFAQLIILINLGFCTGFCIWIGMYGLIGLKLWSY